MSEELKNTALKYSEAGLSVIPLRPKEKIPVVSEWQRYGAICSTKHEVENWWDVDFNRNIGIACGPANGRFLFVVDQDIAKDGSGRRGNIEGLPPTLSQTTGSGGRQLFYWAPAGYIVRNSKPRDLVDIRGLGGQVVVAPSIHPNGNRYVWDMGGFNLEEIQEFPLTELEAFLGKSNDEKLSVNDVLVGLPIGQGLRHMGIAQVSGLLLSKAKTHEEMELFRLAVYEWDRVNNKSPEPVHLRRKEIDAVYNGLMLKELGKRTNEVEITGKVRPQFTTLADLLKEPEEEVSWVVDNLLPSGGFSIIVAKPKVGKSTIARQLALSVARGESFLGYKTTKGSILYVALEEKRGEVQNHFRLLGATGEENLNVYIGSVPDEAYIWLEREVEAKKPILVIIDTLFRFAQVKDVNDYARITAALTPLLDLTRKYSTHLMCVHHARKMSGDGADITLGSTAIFGTVDTAMIITKTREDGRRMIETQQRYGTNIEPTILVFDSYSKSLKLGGTKEEEDMGAMEDKIIKFLKSTNEPIVEKIIQEEVDGKNAIKVRSLRDLVSKGVVIRTGVGGKNDPYKYSCSPVLNPEVGTREQEEKW